MYSSVHKKLYCNRVRLYCSCNNCAFLCKLYWEIFLYRLGHLERIDWKVMIRGFLICSLFCGGKDTPGPSCTSNFCCMWIVSVHEQREHIQFSYTVPNMMSQINGERSWTIHFLKSICVFSMLGLERYEYVYSSCCMLSCFQPSYIFVPCFSVCGRMSSISVYI